ncbi:WGR domain-containing protein [Phytomonospora endophytica]|uniref:Putative DNA-binding WGR domain protein n=1 Tax=Phytomonospora endophytica TaxID=714109 RepID=A0A841FN86_9ACTN|nr:WGR domain-containing protein [Phytomonospora endophytica]MBB6035022.1 putative DNA-binding WGR domain protein [Phytomonospora endophytica]GIG68276.1 hypothetical protein Pen01_45710 [Phytomonospora endophytica]
MAHPHGSLDRFYGMPVPPEVAAAITERLTEPGEPDPVTAHLRPNHAYFGAIDKTLAGFAIIDDHGDDYTLVDLRGGGAIWWQDHETREIHHRLNSIADWPSFLRDRDAGEDDGFGAHAVGEPPPHGRAVSTVELAGRYQWLVWLLAQPLTQHGRPIQSDTDLAGNAAGHYIEAWPSQKSARTALDAEIAGLGTDPHLAVYWLLHTSILAMDAERERVLAALDGPELVRSFAGTFGALGLDGDVPLVPGFRARRSMLAAHIRKDDLGDGPAAVLAAEISPGTHPLLRALDVAAALADESLDSATVAAAVDRMDDGLTRTALRALLDSRAPGTTHSPAADALVAALPSLTGSWTLANWALEWARPVTGDITALTAAVAWLLTKDSHQRAVLAAVRDVQERTGEPVFMTDNDLTRAEADGQVSSRVLKKIIDAPEDTAEILATVDDPALARVIARRVLMRGDTDTELLGAMSWAVRVVLDSGDADGVTLAASCLAMLPENEVEPLIEALAARVGSADDPVTEILLRLVLDTPDPDEGDFLAGMHAENIKKAALRALGPFAHEERIFGPFMAAAEGDGPRTALTPLWNELFYPLEPEHCVIPRLDADQAHRAIRAMIRSRLEHPSIQVRSSAGHQLYRFGHPAVEDFVIEALDRYGARYAASEPKGGRVFDHGQTEDDNLEDLVADLYAILRNLDTPAARTALIDRLFTERRSYWRAANALAETWNEAAHEAITARLRESRDHHAAGLYAYTLDRHVEKVWPLVSLLEEISGWDTPAGPPTDGFFAYALIVGIRAALDTGHYALVRRAWPLAQAIQAPAGPPHLRSWTSPFEDEDSRSRLAAALSGTADAARATLIEKGRAARVKGKPLARLKDEDLGTLTGATVALRLMHDKATGEVWFADTDGRAHAFDGYAVVPPPFTLVPGGPSALTGVTEVSERALFWTATASEFTELVRYRDTIAHSAGVNNGRFTTRVLRFAEGAHEAFARMRASLTAARLTETDPWYVPEKGAVHRGYHREHDSAVLFVHEGRIEYDGDFFPDRAAAVAAHERREIDLLAAGGALGCLEWVGSRRRPEDLTVAEWLDDRARDDSRDPVWHVEALAVFADGLREYGYLSHVPGLADLTVEIGSGVPDEEIAAYEATRRTPVPEVLRDFWRRVGHASWSIGGRGCRVLSPTEMLTRRPAADAVGAIYKAQSYRLNTDVYDELDVVAEKSDGELLTLLATDHETDDDRVFTHVYDHERHIWWERSLSWMLATSFLSEFTQAVKASTHLVERLYFGQHVNAAAESRYFEWRSGPDAKFWELYWDETNGVLATRYGRLGSPGKVSTKRMDPVKGAKKAASLVEAKTGAGYREIP